ncbi:hypothetical protein B0O99DRAFT_688430 [Bisporella sp. PMI_857]|nr:hypothetical protein B0O99DRAFT_688430 [Bisporella sp. PMI_857]
MTRHVSGSSQHSSYFRLKMGRPSYTNLTLRQISHIQEVFALHSHRYAVKLAARTGAAPPPGLPLFHNPSNPSLSSSAALSPSVALTRASSTSGSTTPTTTTAANPNHNSMISDEAALAILKRYSTKYAKIDPDDPNLNLTWGWAAMVIETMVTLRERLTCANCGGMHAMHPSPDLTAAQKTWDYIAHLWLRHGFHGLRRHEILAMREEDILELAEKFREVEKLYLRGVQYTGCRREYNQQATGWLPWYITDGRDKMRYDSQIWWLAYTKSHAPGYGYRA